MDRIPPPPPPPPVAGPETAPGAEGAGADAERLTGTGAAPPEAPAGRGAADTELGWYEGRGMGREGPAAARVLVVGDEAAGEDGL